jgi:hypothetical protein
MKQIQRVIDYRKTEEHEDYLIEKHIKDIAILQRAVADIDYLMIVYSAFNFEIQDDQS